MLGRYSQKNLQHL